jgi:transposase-like protein
MPRTCTVCSHPRRQAVEECLLEGQSYRSIAKRFSISAPALFRHKTHLLESVRRSHDAGEVLRADALADHVKQLRARTEDLYAEAESILGQARRAKDLKTALDGIRTASAVIRETRGNAELLARLTGELQQSSTNQVVTIVLPAAASSQDALDPFPVIDITPSRRW